MPAQNLVRSARVFKQGIVIVLLLLPCARLTAQGPGSFGHQAWMSESGLPQNSVHQVLQTRDGFLWIATEGGIARFDGFDFQTFSRNTDPAMPGDDVCCLAEDTSGTLWAGAFDKLLRFNGGAFAVWNSADGLPRGEVTALLPAADGSLLVLTSDGLVRIEGARAAIVSTSPYSTPSAATTAPDGGFWLASGSQLLRYRAGRVQLARTLSLSALETVFGMQARSDGTLWLRTNRRIIRLRGNSEHTWELGQSLPGTRIESLWVDSGGLAWVGTNHGLATIAANDQVSPGSEEIGVNSILSVAGDREGDVWVGTETAGLHVLRPQQFRTIPALSDQVITSVVQAADGTVWMGTREDGLRRYQSGVVDTPKESGKLASQVVLALAAGTHGDLWIGTPDGLSHMEGAGVSTVGSANGLPDDFVRSLLRDDDGSIWVGTRRGLAHWKDNRIVETITSASGLRSELIGALLRMRAAPGSTSAGDLWIATLQGLSRLHDGHLTTYTTADGLAGNVITSLAQDSTGAVWIGARDGGLTRFADGRFTAFHEAGLPHEVESLVLDSLGSLWLASRRGIARVGLASLTGCVDIATCSPSVSHYGYSNGLPSEEISATGHPASWRTTNGELWFATRKGVAIVDPAHVSETAAMFPVAIERFVVDDVEQPNVTSNLKIAPGHASFNIQYAGLSYSAPSRVRYRYQLEGIDRHWIDAGARRTAYYTNLPPGAYLFRVEAVAADGVWGANSAELHFRVLPPFYRRLWFYLLCALLVGAIVYLAYRLRLRQLNSRFDAVLAERNRIAREIHDTLAQGFVGISVHLELVAQALSAADVTAAGRRIQDTQQLVRDGLADARQSIWELRTLAAQDSLPTRLAKAVELAAQRGTAARLDVTGTYRPLSPKLEGEILRISQEAMANAMRHAHANTVRATLRYGVEHIVLTIEDDGRGFSVADTPAAGDHFGLQGMRERAAEIGAQLEVDSAPGYGTRITLTVNV